MNTGPPPAEPWLLCDRCRRMVYRKRFMRASGVCPDCGWHGPLTAPERLDLMLDPGSVRELELVVSDSDPLAFVDSQPYADRMAGARARTGLREAVMCARGRVQGCPVLMAVMDFRFMGGSLGTAVGEAITRTCELALHERNPLVIVAASGGARMQEGIFSLMQMVKTSAALGRLDEAGILTVSVITDPTYGGVAASFATLCDVIIAEPGARLGFAGPRVIEQTIKQSLPAGFQTAEFLLRHGVIDMICPRAELVANLGALLAAASTSGASPELRPLHSGGPAAGAAGHAGVPGSEASDALVVRDADRLPERDPWSVVRLARRLGRPTTLDYAGLLFYRFTELHGDRMGGDCPAVVCGVGELDGQPVVLVGTQKGHSAQELATRNFGMPSPAGYRKVARVLRMAAKLGLPVITLIDTAGAYPGVEAEQQGQAVAIAECLRLMSGLPVPVVAVVTGEGGSGGALALAVADRVLMCSNAVYSVISPEGCAAILWKDAGAAPAAAAALRVDARHLLAMGVVDGVIPEPGDGSDTDHVAVAARLRDALVQSFGELYGLAPAELVHRRWARFRAFGEDTLTMIEAAENPLEESVAH